MERTQSNQQGPEGVAAAVAGEELPLPPGAGSLPMGIRGGSGGAVGGMGGAPDSSATAGGVGARGGSIGGEEKVESLADILARADDGPGNLKETFRLVGARLRCLPLVVCSPLPVCLRLPTCLSMCTSVLRVGFVPTMSFACEGDLSMCLILVWSGVLPML